MKGWILRENGPYKQFYKLFKDEYVFDLTFQSTLFSNIKKTLYIYC